MNFYRLFLTAFVAILFSLGAINVSKAQTGIFYYPALHETLVHNNIVGIAQAANTEIYLIGKASTVDYGKSVPYFGRFDKKGMPLVHKFYEDFPIWNLRKLIITQGLSLKMYGTTLEKGKYNPFYLQLSPSGRVEGKSPKTVVYNTILSDISSKKDFAVVAHTRIGENKKYNITIHKVNPTDESYDWSTPISTDLNEEATRVIVLSDNSIIVLGKEYKNNMRTYTPIVYSLSSTGKVLWRVGITVPANFFTQDIIQVDRSRFVYMCSYGKEYLGTSETRVIQLSSNGEPLKANTIPNINGNGLLLMDGKKVMLYGSNIAILSGRVVTRAKFSIIDKNLETEYQRELGSTDVPDVLMPQRIATSFPTTSDFSSAVQLLDGRIALTGKVFMPADPKNPSIKGNDRYNAPLLVILDKNGRGI
ncbi:MAG: hypothetical protein PHU27_10365 [Salinivirgaceae bacterium]|nr:hypothetical protein [Salinivirgaceae bacterium]MDY0281027.1 hypothetical protein [Salinivirgaceae bacterium]